MKKFNVAWIILIGFCSLIIIGGIFYVIYRLYIQYIYKRNRPWCEMTCLLKNESEKIIGNDSIFPMPRSSISPLIQEYLPDDMKKQQKKRKMITNLQFVDPPLSNKSLKTEWQEMDAENSFLSPLISTSTLYYTMEDQCTCEESKTDESSSMKYFSVTSPDEFLTPQKQSPFQTLFNPLINLSKRLRSNEESFVEKNLSSNHIILDMEPIEIINLSNNVSQP